jgi:hypothetical protein
MHDFLLSPGMFCAVLIKAFICFVWEDLFSLLIAFLSLRELLGFHVATNTVLI